MDAYTAKDILKFEDYNGEWIISDLANATVVELAADTELSTITTGYNGNGLGAHNEPGRQRLATLRLVKASGDDKRLNENYTLWKNRDSNFKPLKASFTKQIAHSDGSISTDTLYCYFGLPSGQPGASQNTEGDTEQVVSVYTIRFADHDRVIK